MDTVFYHCETKILRTSIIIIIIIIIITFEVTLSEILYVIWCYIPTDKLTKFTQIKFVFKFGYS